MYIKKPVSKGVAKITQKNFTILRRIDSVVKVINGKRRLMLKKRRVVKIRIPANNPNTIVMKIIDTYVPIMN